MFKNSILRYLNSAAVFDTDDAIARQRAEIAAQVTVGNRSETESNNENNNSSENDDNNEKDEGEKDEGEEEDDEGNDDNNNENETDEQKQARLAKAKEDRRNARMQKRIDRLTAENKLTKTELDKLRKQIDEKPVEGLTEEEVQRRAEALAEKIVQDRNHKTVEKQFEDDCDDLRKQAIKVNKNFDNDVKTMAEEVAPIPAVMIGMLTDLENENGGAVLNYLTANPDEYEDILELRQGKQMQRLVRISDKLKAEADAAKQKAKNGKSKTPTPIAPIIEGRDNRSNNVLPSEPTKNMDDFVRIRNQQAEERRKSRGY